MEQKKRIEVKIKSYELPPDVTGTENAASATPVKASVKAAVKENSKQNNDLTLEKANQKKKFVVVIKDDDEIASAADIEKQDTPKEKIESKKTTKKPYELDDTVARIIAEADAIKEKSKEHKENESLSSEQAEENEIDVPIIAAVEEEKTEKEKKSKASSDSKKTTETKNSKSKNKKKKKNKYEPKSPVARFFKKFVPWAGDGPLEVIRKMIFIVALIVAVACIYIIIEYYSSVNDSKEKNDKLAQMHEQLELEDSVADKNDPGVSVPEDDSYVPPMIRSQKYYYDMNNDVVGWIEIENTRVNLPILQSDDNDYYLDKDIKGMEDEYGCIYIDYRCVFTHNDQSDNLVIYGHDTKTDSMFGDLDQYKPSFGTIRFLKEHPVINLNSNYYKSQYVIFAVIITNSEEKDGEVWPYHNEIEFTDELDFMTFVSNAKKRSMYDTGIDVEFGEKMITLSTCATDFEDSRLVVIARELREGETGYDYIDNYEYNENTLYPDTWYYYKGGKYDDTDTRYDIETLYPNAVQ